MTKTGSHTSGWIKSNDVVARDLDRENGRE